jgi:hypothetical protein
LGNVSEAIESNVIAMFCGIGERNGMRTISAAIFAILFFTAACWTVPTPPKEKLKIILTDEFVQMLQEDSLSAWTPTDTTDLDLPPIPIYKVPVYPPAGRSVSPLDTATVTMIITRRGNVKRAWIVSTTNEYYNKAVLKSVIQWRFQPALRHGVPVDTIMTYPIGLSVSGLD